MLLAYYKVWLIYNIILKYSSIFSIKLIFVSACNSKVEKLNDYLSPSVLIKSKVGYGWMNPTCTGTQNLKYHEIIAQTYFCNRTTRNEFLIQSFGGRRGKLLFFRIFRRPSRSSNHFIFKTVFRHKKLHRESSSTTHI